MIYWALCHHLEMTDCITDAVECCNQMDSESVQETNTHGEQVAWAVGKH